MLSTILIVIAMLLAILGLAGVSSRVNLVAIAVLFLCAALLVGKM